MLEILKAIVYGIVEGITEWLPVSSTGHMILLEEIMPMKVSQEFWNMFLVVVQLGAILAVVLLFWNRIFPLKRNRRRQIRIDWNIMNLWGKILVACIPAGIVGILFDDWLEEHLYNGQHIPSLLNDVFRIRTVVCKCQMECCKSCFCVLIRR